jgi:1-acyl-sn-glycerol-3-phosphate acyltransferase
MRRAVLGLYTYAEFFGQMLAFLPVMAASSVRHRHDPTQRVPGRWMRRFGRSTSRATSLWKFSVEGDAPPDIASRAYVVVANHESTADPFLLSSLPWDMRWIAKEELFKLPLIGWMMKFGGDIPLRRGDRASVQQMMAEATNTLRHGLSIMMFPEGTRSATGELGPFKDGAFQLAIDAGVPVLPLAVAGTRACRPKGSLWFGEARATVKVLEPIDGAGHDVASLREEARRRIAAALPGLREATGQATGRKSAPPRKRSASSFASPPA